MKQAECKDKCLEENQSTEEKYTENQKIAQEISASIEKINLEYPTIPSSEEHNPIETSKHPGSQETREEEKTTDQVPPTHEDKPTEQGTFTEKDIKIVDIPAIKIEETSSKNTEDTPAKTIEGIPAKKIEDSPLILASTSKQVLPPDTQENISQATKRTKEETEEISPIEQTPFLSPLPVFFMICLSFLSITNIFNSHKSFLLAKDALYQSPSFHEVFEEEFIHNINGKFNYIHINGAFSRMMKNVELNNMVRLENGYLVAFGDSIPEKTMKEMSENMILFQQYLEERDIPFTFILAPHQLPTDDEEMIPTGYENFGVANEKADDFLSYFTDSSLDILDLRERIQEAGINHYDLFPRTDLHWNTDGGFWAHKEIVSQVDNLLDTEYLIEEYTNRDSYQRFYHPLIWLGARGQRTGMFFAGLDDIIVLLPNFDTDILCVADSISHSVRGDFETALYNENAMTPSDPPYYDSGVIYNIYLQGNLVDYYKIINYQTENELKVLMLRDSCSLNVAPFLSLHWNELHLYDLRYGSISAFLDLIDKIQPDIVLQMVSVDGLNDIRFFQYS